MRPALALLAGWCVAAACGVGDPCGVTSRLVLASHTVLDAPLAALVGAVVDLDAEVVTVGYDLDGVRYEVELTVTGGQLFLADDVVQLPR
jgi:hypothetical protein